MKKKNVKKLVLAKETVQKLDFGEVRGAAGSEFSCIELSCFVRCVPPTNN